MFPASKNIKLWGGGTPSKQRVIEKKFFYFFIVAEIRSDETPSIFNFKKGEIMKHPTEQVKVFKVNFVYDRLLILQTYEREPCRSECRFHFWSDRSFSDSCQLTNTSASCGKGGWVNG